jgi:hypothetical protein
MSCISVKPAGGVLETLKVLHRGVLMRGWFPIFREVEVGRLVEISMLVKKAPNRRSKPCNHYTMALLVTNTCAHELASPRRLNSCTSKNKEECN